MPIVRVRAVLGPDLLKLPELAPLLGQEVEVRVRKARTPPTLESMIDHKYHEQCRREEAADPTPPPTLEEVRAMNASLGGLSADIIAGRG
jgi:hypothetical protein